MAPRREMAPGKRGAPPRAPRRAERGEGQLLARTVFAGPRQEVVGDTFQGSRAVSPQLPNTPARRIGSPARLSWPSWVCSTGPALPVTARASRSPQPSRRAAGTARSRQRPWGRCGAHAHEPRSGPCESSSFDVCVRPVSPGGTPTPHRCLVSRDDFPYAMTSNRHLPHLPASLRLFSLPFGQ